MRHWSLSRVRIGFGPWALLLFVLPWVPIATAAPQRARPPMRAPAEVLLRAAPVTVRIEVPPEILAELRDPSMPSSDQDYEIEFDGVTLLSYKTTAIRGFARRWATAWTSELHRQCVGSFTIISRSNERSRPVQRVNASLSISRDQLRRATHQRTYFPLTLVQVHHDGRGPRHGVTTRIDRIYLAKTRSTKPQ